MKLKDLVSKVIIQGDIRLSVWDEDDDEEIKVTYIKSSDMLTVSDISDYKNLIVKYMFVAQDNVLHIELVYDRRR